MRGAPGQAVPTTSSGTRVPVDEMVDEVEEAFVGPVEVLEDEDERLWSAIPSRNPRHAVNASSWLSSRPATSSTPPTGGDERGPFDVVVRQSRRDDRPELSLGLVLRVRLEDAGCAFTISPSAQKLIPSP